MEATIVNFRQGRHHIHEKQMVLKAASSADAAAKLVGKTVTWTSSSGKEIKGRITGLHGKTGSVKAQFSEKGLPGQALGKKIKVN